MLLAQPQRFIFGYLFELAAVARFRRLKRAGVVVAVLHSDFGFVSDSDSLTVVGPLWRLPVEADDSMWTGCEQTVWNFGIFKL